MAITEKKSVMKNASPCTKRGDCPWSWIVNKRRENEDCRWFFGESNLSLKSNKRRGLPEKKRNRGLDCLVHNAYKINMKGGLMRKKINKVPTSC